MPTSKGPDYDWNPAEIKSLVDRAKTAVPEVARLFGDLVKEHEQAIEIIDRLEGLLLCIRQWDMLDVAADGPYWKSEIDKVLKQ